jgi:hypothetical protein
LDRPWPGQAPALPGGQRLFFDPATGTRALPCCLEVSFEGNQTAFKVKTDVVKVPHEV